MADNLTDTAENLALNFLFNAVTATRPTTPPKCRLMASPFNATDSAAGTEITAGGGYTAGGAAVTFGTAGAVTAGLIENSTAVTWTNMPATTITGIEIWDTSGSPIRLAYGTLTANKTTNAGDTFTIAIGDIDITLA